MDTIHLITGQRRILVWKATRRYKEARVVLRCPYEVVGERGNEMAGIAGRRYEGDGEFVYKIRRLCGIMGLRNLNFSTTFAPPISTLPVIFVHPNIRSQAFPIGYAD